MTPDAPSMKTTILFSSLGDKLPLPPERQRHHPPFCMTSASIVTTVGAIVTTLIVGANEAAAVAAKAGVQQELTELQWASFPFVGAMFASIMSILFKKDDWRENAARFIGAAIAGVGIPKLATFLHPSLKEWGADPILLILFGFGWGMVGFGLARWGFTWINRRGPEIAQKEAEKWADEWSRKGRKDQEP